MTSILVTNLTLDEIFLQMQPDEASRQEAIEWLKNQKSNEIPNDQKIPGQTRAVQDAL